VIVTLRRRCSKSGEATGSKAAGTDCIPPNTRGGVIACAQPFRFHDTSRNPNAIWSRASGCNRPASERKGRAIGRPFDVAAG
jgi:hypothetical protein